MKHDEIEAKVLQATALVQELIDAGAGEKMEGDPLECALQSLTEARIDNNE